MKRFTVAALTTALALAGCAVLTVDVDVYKGPLVNHEDVQMEQLAVMAIGARPLLIQLREGLENACRQQLRDDYEKDKTGKDPAEQPLLTFQTNGQASPGCLQSKEAVVVDGILGLYLDQPPESISRIYAEGRELFQEAAALRKELDDFEGDRALWARIERALAGLQSVDQTHEGVRDAFQSALILKEGDEYRDLSKLSQRLSDDANAPSFATSQFELLTLAGRVEAAVDELLPRTEVDPELRAELVQRLERLGAAFLDGRELVDRGLALTLDLIREVATSEPPLEKRTEILDTLVAAVAALIDRKGVVAAVRNESARSRNIDPGVAVLCARATNDGAFYAQLDAALQRWLRADPAGASAALKQLHVDLKAGFQFSDPTKSQIPFDEFSDPARRRFGIARALTLSDEDSANVGRGAASWDGLRNLFDYFGDGRLQAGLLTLIDNYLKARDVLGASQDESDAVKLARRKLTDELTHFAEKVLFVVNNDAVLHSGKQDNDAYVMVLESIGNSILTLNDELHRRWQDDDKQTQRPRAERERNAALAAWRTDPVLLYDDIVRAVLADGVVVPKSLLVVDDATVAAATEVDAAIRGQKEAEQALTKLTQKKMAADKLRAAWLRDRTKEATNATWMNAGKDDTSLRERIDELAKHLEAEHDQLVAPTHTENDDSLALQLVARELRTRKSGAPATDKRSRAGTIAYVTAAIDKDVVSDHDLANAEARKTTADEALRKKREERADALKNFKDVEDVLGAANAARQRSIERLQQKTAELVRAARSNALIALTKNASDPRSPPLGHSDVLAALTAELKARAEPLEAGKPEKEAFADAITLVNAQPLTELPAALLPANPERPSDVLDQIIATLRTARIAAQAQGNQAADANLERALQIAEQSRSPMVYIRPPASFLRNSSPITSLQENQVGWHNMLTGLSGTALGVTPDKAAGERAKTQTAIDKQFWQNINRIRVTGGGDTTYALVKDDIGNWYVKGYVGDPKVVIKGVQAMALAAASGGMKADLLQRADDMTQAKLTGKPLEKKRSVTVLGKQIDHFADVYDDATEKHATELKKEIDGLAAKVKSAWSGKLVSNSGLLTKDADAMHVVVDDAAKAAFDKAPTAVPQNKGREQANFCGDLLKRTADFEEMLLEGCPKSLVNSQPADTARNDVKKAEAKLLEAAAENIAAAKDELSKARAALEQAEKDEVRARTLVRDLRRAAIDLVGGVAQKFADHRADAIEDYETALQILGQRPRNGAATPTTGASTTNP